MNFTKTDKGFYEYSTNGFTGTIQIVLEEEGQVMVLGNIGNLEPTIIVNQVTDNALIDLSFKSTVKLTFRTTKPVKASQISQ